MISLRKSNVDKITMSLQNFGNDDKPSYMMPYDVSKEVLREVQEMRKSFTMRTHVWRRVFLAQEKQERSSVPMLRTEAQPLKEALPEDGSIIFILPC
jgi:hypothetical protein